MNVGPCGRSRFSVPSSRLLITIAGGGHGGTLQTQAGDQAEVAQSSGHPADGANEHGAWSMEHGAWSMEHGEAEGGKLSNC